MFLVPIDIYIKMLCKIESKKPILLIPGIERISGSARICLLCQRDVMCKRAHKGHL